MYLKRSFCEIVLKRQVCFTSDCAYPCVISLFSNLEIRRPTTVKIFLHYVSKRSNFVDFSSNVWYLNFVVTTLPFLIRFSCFFFLLLLLLGVCRYFVLGTKYKVTLVVNFVRLKVWTYFLFVMNDIVSSFAILHRNSLQ